MAVGRLSGKWILEVLQTGYPDGVLRRVLLDRFASVLVSGRSSPGAKGRLARRLYARLAALQRKGWVIQEEGVIHLATPGLAARAQAMPLLGPILLKKQFLALLAEDRNEGGPDAPRLLSARWGFLACAIEQGWTAPQAASALGITAAKAAAIMAIPPPRKEASAGPA